MSIYIEGNLFKNDVKSARPESKCIKSAAGVVRYPRGIEDTHSHT